MDETREILDFSRLPDVSELHPELAPEERWYAAHMKAREDALLYVFGESAPPGQILSPSEPELQAQWPGGGVCQYPPRERRGAWHYITTGLAQPLTLEATRTVEVDPAPVSGLGIELVLSSAEPAVWAPNILLDLVRYLLFAENATVFVPGERIPYTGFEHLGQPTPLTHLLALTSPEYASEILLPAGHCALVHLVGVTAAEVERARALDRPETPGSEVLAGVLVELGQGFVTDPARECLTEHPLFDEVWHEVEERVRGAG